MSSFLSEVLIPLRHSSAVGGVKTEAKPFMKLNSFAGAAGAIFSTEIVEIVICYLFHAIFLVEGVDATRAGASSGKPWRSAGRLTSRQTLVSILQN